VNGQLWRRAAVGVAAGAAGYLAVRAVRRAARIDEDGGRRSFVRAVTIYRPIAEVYAFWRDLPNLARALGHVVRVDEVDDQRSRWIVEGPGNSEIEFIVEIVVDEPQRVIGWRAENAPLPHEGRVEFGDAPGGRGTEVRLRVTYLPTGSPAADTLVIPLSDDRADRLLYDAVRRVKQIIEAGEVITVDGQSSGRDELPQRVPALLASQLTTGSPE
jgi:uncharacterized membrane protein